MSERGMEGAPIKKGGGEWRVSKINDAMIKKQKGKES